MARGKKTEPEVIYKIMASYAITQNKNETAKLLGISESTVRKVIEENKNNPEFAKVCEQKKADFEEQATDIIYKILERIKQEIEDDENNIPLNQLSATLGVLYDKRALSRGESTDNKKVEIKLPPEVTEYAV